jgi:hypothetical protein
VQDLVTGVGAIAFLLGILAVGLGGNQRMRFRSLMLIAGWALIVAGTGAEMSAILAERGGGGDASQGAPSGG